MNSPRTPDSIIRTSIEAALRRLPDPNAANRHAIYARARKTIAENSPDHLTLLDSVIAEFELDYAPDDPQQQAGPEIDALETERPPRRWRKPRFASAFFAGVAAILILAAGAASWWLYQADNTLPEAGFETTAGGSYVMRARDFSQRTILASPPLAFSWEDAALRLSGNLKGAASTGRTAGISFALPEEIEREASGKTATITIVGTSDTEATIWVAYSTNEVGNSGWQKLAVGGGVDSVSFTYEVPQAASYAGDFIGILPDPAGKGNTFLLEAIGIELR